MSLRQVLEIGLSLNRGRVPYCCRYCITRESQTHCCLFTGDRGLGVIINDLGHASHSPVKSPVTPTTNPSICCQWSPTTRSLSIYVASHLKLRSIFDPFTIQVSRKKSDAKILNSSLVHVLSCQSFDDDDDDDDDDWHTASALLWNQYWWRNWPFIDQ